MPFDPSIISQIPNMAPNPVAATAEAYKLSDMIDRNQLNKMTLNQEKQKEEEGKKIKEILSKSDLSTSEGQNAAGAEISKISPSVGMDFIKQVQDTQKGKGELQKQQYELLQHKNEVIGTEANNLFNQYDSMVRGGMPPQQAIAAMQPKYQETIQRLSQTKLPDGSPALQPHDLQAVQANPQFNPDFIRGLAEQSKQSAAALKSHLEERKEQEVERHNRATEDNQVKKTAATTGEGLSDAAKQLSVDRILSGEKASSVLSNFGRGAQGAKDLRAVQNLLAETAKARGISGPQLVKIMQSTAADGRAVLELGAREGKIASRVQEAQNFAVIAKKASEAVQRGNFVQWNKLKQMSESQMSDPALAKLKAATVSLVNAYAAAVGGGTPTVHDKEAAELMLSTAQGPDAYNAVVDQLILETEKALEAPGQVRERMTGVKAQTQPAQPIQDPKQTNAGDTANDYSHLWK